MRNPLRYQATRFDCGATTFINALLYLFQREEMPPDVLQYVYAVTLDKYHDDAHPGGTSGAAMRFLAEWITEYGQSTGFPVAARHLRNSDVALAAYCQVVRWIDEGGCAIASCHLTVDHYVLFTGINRDKRGNIVSVRMFDPWLEDLNTAYASCGHFFGITPDDIRVVRDHPFSHNRVVSVGLIDRLETGAYSFTCATPREITLVRRTD